MATEYTFHPAADLFPLMDGEAFESLKADIKEHGQREYIVLLDGKILDGRNRYRACCELGIDPEFCEMEECADPVAYAVSANLHRRHLSTSQRSMIAAKLAGLRNGQHQQAVSIDTAQPLPIEQAAELLNVSRPSVTAALDVLRTGDQETIAEVESGKLAVSKAAKAKKPRKAKPKSGGKSAVVHLPGVAAAMLGILTVGTTTSVLGEITSALRQEFKADDICDPISEANEKTLLEWKSMLAEIVTVAEAMRKLIANKLSAKEPKKAGPKHRPAPSGRGRRNPTTSVSAESDEKPELFPIERHDDGWVVVLPNGEFTDPFISKRAAEQQAVRCRQLAQDDPEFLRIQTRDN